MPTIKGKKAGSLFEREMENPDFRKRYNDERGSFALEVQFQNLLESRQTTFAEFARKMGVPRANVTRDLSLRGIRRATLPRVSRMADAVDADAFTVILPRDPAKRRVVFDRLAAEVMTQQPQMAMARKRSDTHRRATVTH